MATLGLLLLIVIASVAGFARPAMIERSLLRPYRIAHGSDYRGLIVSGFVHADTTHLIFNLITFYSFGLPLERAIGTPQLLTLYFAGLLISNLGTTLQHRAEPDYAALGASGAILAVLFAAIVYFPHARLIMWPLPLPLPGPLWALLYLGYTWYSSRRARGRINHDAHLFGALTGVLFVAVTDPGRIGLLWRTLSPD